MTHESLGGGGLARVLVTGAGGLVGSRVAVRLRSAHEVHAAFHLKPPPQLGLSVDRLHTADVADPAKFTAMLDRVQPEVVVHCAALTDVDGCEGRADEARRVNVAPVALLAARARKAGMRVVLMSTDFVFDGTKPPYEVDATPNPLCVYSASKAEAEAALKGVPGALVLRSAVIYGADYGHGKTNFATWLFHELKAGRPVRIVRDQFNNPTIAEMIADFVAKAVERKAEGVLHAAGSECVARDDFARKLAARFDLDGSLITPVPTASLNQRAKRPARACLSMARSEAALGVKAWPIAKSLDLLHRQMGALAQGPQAWW